MKYNALSKDTLCIRCAGCNKQEMPKFTGEYNCERFSEAYTQLDRDYIELTNMIDDIVNSDYSFSFIQGDASDEDGFNAGFIYIGLATPKYGKTKEIHTYDDRIQKKIVDYFKKG